MEDYDIETFTGLIPEGILSIILLIHYLAFYCIVGPIVV